MIKVFTAFSGYDSQCLALDRLQIDYDLVGWSEIDKIAINAHNALFPQYSKRNFGDICKIDFEKVPDFDLFTYSFPCTDISTVGLQRGFAEGSDTKSSLLWVCKKAIETKLPRFLLMENVKALANKKFIQEFLKWDKYLRQLGYVNFTKVLNAKDFCIPQNRERIFVVSIMGGGWYDFPEKHLLKIRVKDILEKKVSNKYYLSDCIRSKFEQTDFINQFSHKEITDNFILYDDYNQRILNNQNVMGTITTNIGNSALRNGYKIIEIGIEDGKLIMIKGIRKFTPREVFRLMGLKDTDINKIQSTDISDRQQYKLAGNSIVVDILYYIFCNLFKIN